MTPQRYLELEAFRGVAAVAVVVYHAWQHTHRDGLYPFSERPLGTFLGSLDAPVAVFLTLSGFLLFLPVARSTLDGRPGRRARSFLRRRSARVLPLYLIAVLCVWAFRTPAFPGDWRDLLAHLTFTQIYWERTIFSLIGPAWSLAVEVTFYVILALLLWPLSRVAVGVSSARTRLVVLVAVPALLVAGSVAFKAWAFAVADIPLDRFTVYFSVPAKLDEFALGMLLAVVFAVRRDAEPWSAHAVNGLRLGALALAVTAVVLRDPGSWGAVMFHTAISLATVLLIAGTLLAPSRSWWVRVTSAAPLAALGLWSYSVYIWHEPLMGQLSRRLPMVEPGEAGFLWLAAFLVPLSVLVGWMSYWVIEYPTSVLAQPIPRRTGDARSGGHRVGRA